MSIGRVDPYLDRGPVPPSMVRIAGVTALGLSLVYLVGRLWFTLDGAAPEAVALLLIAEIVSVTTFAARLAVSWHEPAELVEMPDAPVPSTTVVIDATGATADQVRTSLVSCRRLRGVERTIVADRNADPWVAVVADRFNASIVVSAATTAVAETNAMWVLLVRAGDLPLPDALEMVATMCSSPEVGIVQLGAEEANPSSFVRAGSIHRSLSAFDHEVVRPSLAARASVPWYGDVPTMVRPAAIRDAPATDVPTCELGLHATSIGYRVTLVPRTLARIQGPETVAKRIEQRAEILGPLRRMALRRLPNVLPATRWAVRASLIDSVSALRWPLLAVVAVLAVGAGRVPLGEVPQGVLALAVAAYGCRWVAHLVLGRDRIGRLGRTRTELRSLAVDLAFGHRTVGARDHHPILLGSMSVSVLIAIAAGMYTVWVDGTPNLPLLGSVVVLGLIAGFLLIAIDVLFEDGVHHQRRGTHRVNLGLVICKIGPHEGQLLDLSVHGCGAVVPVSPDELPERGSEVAVSFRIPNADGAWRDVAAIATLAHIAPLNADESRLGLVFVSPVDVALDPVIEFLTIDRRQLSIVRRLAEVAQR